MNKKDYQTNMKYIAKMYKENKKEIEENKNTIASYKLDSNVEFVEHIDLFLSLMPYEIERIIRKDFLEDRQVKWWLEHYSKSTYYRRKEEAIELFVDCLS